MKGRAKFDERVRCAMLFAVLIPLEIACAFLAFETIGEVVSAAYLLAVALNGLFLFAAIWSRRAAVMAALALGLLIIPYQLVLGLRLLRVQAEASRIVDWAYEHRLAAGSFPKDLTSYIFNDAATRPYIQSYYLSRRHDEFTVLFCVGTTSTSHWYSSRGGWGYYPD